MKTIQKMAALLLTAGLAGYQAQAQIRPTIQKEIRLVNPAESGTGHVSLRAAEGTATYNLTVPGTLPAAGGILKVGSVSGSSATMEWQSLSNAVSSVGWSLEGNSITTGGTANGQQFIGTTNTQPLVLATTHATAQPIIMMIGNTERMRLTADGNLQVQNLNGTAAATLPTGFDRIVVADNTGLIKQASIDAVLTGNGYYITKARGVSTPASAVESLEVSPVNGLGNAVSIDANDVIQVTLESASNDMPVPSYYISRNTGTGKFTIYFSAGFTGTCNWTVTE